MHQHNNRKGVGRNSFYTHCLVQYIHINNEGVKMLDVVFLVNGTQLFFWRIVADMIKTIQQHINAFWPLLHLITRLKRYMMFCKRYHTFPFKYIYINWEFSVYILFVFPKIPNHTSLKTFELLIIQMNYRTRTSSPNDIIIYTTPTHSSGLSVNATTLNMLLL